MYVRVMMKSEIHRIELVTRMVGRNDLGDKSYLSPTLLEAVDEQDVECDVVLTQLSQETQDDTNADELLLLVVMKVLNVELISKSVGVGDVVADAKMILGVDPQPIGIGFTVNVDVPSVEPEFIP
jgi:hypothetical protein